MHSHFNNVEKIKQKWYNPNVWGFLICLIIYLFSTNLLAPLYINKFANVMFTDEWHQFFYYLHPK